MKSASAALQTHLASELVTTVVDLVTVTLPTAAVHRWTNHSRNITTGGFTWTSGGTGTAPIPARGSIRDTLGLDPSELELTLFCGDTAELGSGVRLQAAAEDGRLDSAEVRLDRCYLDAAGAVIGTLLRFQGTTADVRVSSSRVVLKARSYLDRLNMMLPRHLHRPLCSHALGDAGCAVDLSGYAYSGTVNGTPTDMVFTSSAAGAGTGYYTDGYLVFTSGALNGVKRDITLYVHATTSFTVAYPLPSTPAVGDTFTAYPGCDKTISTCNTKFINLPRRRGSDFLPAEDMVGG